MRIIVAFVALLLFFGCIDLGERGNVTETQENITEPVSEPVLNGSEMVENESVMEEEPIQENRYFTPSFSFTYPENMEIQTTDGIFAANHDLDGETAEILTVTYVNTTLVYGVNKDKIFKEDPGKAASDLLQEDIEHDPSAMLDDAYDIGEIYSYSIVRDAYVAEVPFTRRFSEAGPRYAGYALSIYIPERSIQIRMRLIALNAEKADDIKDEFLTSFRIE